MNQLFRQTSVHIMFLPLFLPFSTIINVGLTMKAGESILKRKIRFYERKYFWHESNNFKFFCKKKLTLQLHWYPGTWLTQSPPFWFASLSTSFNFKRMVPKISLIVTLIVGSFWMLLEEGGGWCRLCPPLSRWPKITVNSAYPTKLNI